MSAARKDALALIALRVIEDAVARAEVGHVERTWGHRLALQYLVQAGVAESWQAATVWDHLAWQSDRNEFAGNAAYVQTTSLMASVKSWSYRLGLMPLDPMQMRRLANRYIPALDFGSGTQQLPCMCNRYRPGERETIRSHFNARLLRETNEGPPIVHPKEPGWVVRLDNGERVLEQMTWGFPVYLRGKSGQPLKVKPVNNARFDKLGAYWKRWAANPANRCLIPATDYAEAVGPAGAMKTTWLSVQGAPLFAWAGLWRPSDEWGACYTGVMTDNAPELLSIHDRSPVILTEDDFTNWLTAPFEALVQFDRPWPADQTVVNRTDILWKDGGRVIPPPPGEFGPASA